MIQEIIVFLLVALCIGYAVYTFVRQFRASDGDGCAGGCSHCSAEKVNFDSPKQESSQKLVSSISFPSRK